MQKQDQDIKQATQKKKVLLISLSMYWNDIENILETVASDWKIMLYSNSKFLLTRSQLFHQKTGKQY